VATSINKVCVMTLKCIYMEDLESFWSDQAAALIVGKAYAIITGKRGHIYSGNSTEFGHYTGLGIC